MCSLITICIVRKYDERRQLHFIHGIKLKSVLPISFTITFETSRVAKMPVRPCSWHWFRSNPSNIGWSGNVEHSLRSRFCFLVHRWTIINLKRYFATSNQNWNLRYFWRLLIRFCCRIIIVVDISLLKYLPITELLFDCDKTIKMI